MGLRKSRKGSIEKKLKRDLKKKRVSRHYRKFKKSIGGQGTGLGFTAEKMAETDSLTPEQWEAAIEAGLEEDKRKSAQVPEPYVAQGSIAKTEELQNNENVSPVEYMATGSVEKDTKLEDNIQAKITPLTGLSTQGEQEEVNVGQIGEEEEAKKNNTTEQEPVLAQAQAPPEYAPQGEKREPTQLTNNNMEISEPKLIGRSTITPIASYTIPEENELEKPLSPFEIFINVLKTHSIHYLNIFGSIFYLEKLYGFTTNANIKPAMYSLQSFKEMFNVKEEDLCKTIKAYAPLFGIRYADFRNQKAPIDAGYKRGASAEDDEILKITLKHYRELLNNRVQLNIQANINSRISSVQLKKVDSYIAFLEGEGGERVAPLAGVSCDVGVLKELPQAQPVQGKPFDCKDMKDCPELKAIRRLLSLLIMKNKESPTVVDKYLEGQDDKILTELLELIQHRDGDGANVSASASESASVSISAIKDETTKLVETLKAELEELKKTQTTTDTTVLEDQIKALSGQLEKKTTDIQGIQEALKEIQEQLAAIPGTDALQVQIDELSKKAQPIVMDKEAILKIVQEYMEEHYPKKEVEAIEQASQTVDVVSEAVQSGEAQKINEAVEKLNASIDEVANQLNEGLALKADVETIKTYATANSVEKLSAKLEELKAKLGALEAQQQEKSGDSTIDDILRRLVEAEGKVATTENKVATTEDKLSALETKPSTPDYGAAIEELKTALAQSQEQSRQAIANMTDAVAAKNAEQIPRTEFDELKGQLTALQEEKTAQAEEQIAQLAQLNQSYSAVMEQLENHKVRIEALETEKDAIRRDMTNLINIPGEISGLSEKLNSLTAKLGEKDIQMNALKDQMTAKDTELTTIKGELEQRMDDLKKEVVAKQVEMEETKPVEIKEEEKPFQQENPLLTPKDTSKIEEKTVEQKSLIDYFNSFYNNVKEGPSLKGPSTDLTLLFKLNRDKITSYISIIRGYNFSTVIRNFDKKKDKDNINTFYNYLLGKPSYNDAAYKNSDRIIYGLFKIFMEYTIITDMDGKELSYDEKINTIFTRLNETLGKYVKNNISIDVIIGIFQVNDPTIQTLEQVKEKLVGNLKYKTGILGERTRDIRSELVSKKYLTELLTLREIEKENETKPQTSTIDPRAQQLRNQYAPFSALQRGKYRGGADEHTIDDAGAYTIGGIALRLIGGVVANEPTDEELEEMLGGYTAEERSQLAGHLAFLKDVYEVATVA